MVVFEWQGICEMDIGYYTAGNKPVDMSKHRHFGAMQRRHRRLLMDISCCDEDFDYGWLHEYIVRKLRNMLEFYESGYSHTDFANCQRIKKELREAIRLSEECDRHQYLAGEERTVADFYRYLGDHISSWWS